MYHQYNFEKALQMTQNTTNTDVWKDAFSILFQDYDQLILKEAEFIQKQKEENNPKKYHWINDREKGLNVLFTCKQLVQKHLAIVEKTAPKWENMGQWLKARFLEHCHLYRENQSLKSSLKHSEDSEAFFFQLADKYIKETIRLTEENEILKSQLNTK